MACSKKEQQEFNSFVIGLAKLSKKHNIILQSFNGACVMHNDSGKIKKVVYSNEINGNITATTIKMK